jgi:hypothetical protein
VEERFVLVQTRFAKRLDLDAEMVFELLDIGGADRLPSPEVLPPFPNAFLQQPFFESRTKPKLGLS